MLTLTFALLAGGVPQDTLRPTVAEALERAAVHAPALVAARRREEAATHIVDQAGAIANPRLSTKAENVGGVERTSGLEGWRGVEGEALLGFTVPLGGDRGAALRRAGALRDAAGAERERTEAELRMRVLLAIAEVQRDAALAGHAAEERATLGQLADALTLGAAEGRFAEGDAARARIAVVLAATEEARRRAVLTGSDAALAYLLGLAPGAAARVRAEGTCRLAPTRALPPPPEEALIAARIEVAAAETARTDAARIPNLHPLIGARRTGGISVMQLGFEVDLPLFDRGSAAAAAVRAEEAAVQAEMAEWRAETEVARSAALREAELLAAAGESFDDRWSAALERSAVATQALHESGEGTLTELLDGRRARLQALDDFARWQAELHSARIRAARLGALPLDENLLCSGVPAGGAR